MNPIHLNLDARIIDDDEVTLRVAFDSGRDQEVDEEGKESVKGHSRFHFGHQSVCERGDDMQKFKNTPVLRFLRLLRLLRLPVQV